MRVLLVNTSENAGGAAIAAARLKEALINNGIKAKLLVREKVSDSLSVVGLEKSWRLRWHFLWERFVIWRANHFHREGLFDVDIANCGTDITSLREFREADVIHLHWINQGFLSLKDLQKILSSGKPVVWTLHDEWPFTGICHCVLDCEKYRTGCSDCPQLYHGGRHDLSQRTFQRKEKMLSASNVAFVACSRWIAGLAQQSLLLRGKLVENIPNPINTTLFSPRDKDRAREECRLPQDKKLILFSAYNITSSVKGLKYFVEACDLYRQRHPEMDGQIAIVAAGKEAGRLAEMLPYPVYPMGYVTDERRMARIYNCCDAFVISSLQENLPNTIAEAMASGVPCIGFKVGGIPQMIEHKVTGYLAEPKQSNDLAAGLEWLFNECDYSDVSLRARTVAAGEYSEHAVAMRYIEIYNKLSGKTYE